LQPHFPFNTLSAIVVPVRQQKSDQAEDMLSKLSDLLRRALSDSYAQEGPLRRELEFLNSCLSIEKVRFQGRLTVNVTPEPDALEAKVPHLCSQPTLRRAGSATSSS
jgi:LytS/YehU family sensor histidine kinase